MSVIIKPIITEKATGQSELTNCYSFYVNTKANKIEVKNAIEAQYGVSVLKVNTLIENPTRTTKYTKDGIIKGKSNVMKKAFVYLKEGEEIDFYNNI